MDLKLQDLMMLLKVAAIPPHPPPRRSSIDPGTDADHSVLVKEQRVSNLTSQLKIGYQTMGLFSGSAGNSGIAECVAAVEQKLLELRTLAAEARLFSEDAKSLSQSSIEDIDRVHTSQAGALKRAQALREELEREQSSVEARNAERRDSRDRTRPI